MPLEVHKIQSFDTKLIREPQTDNELTQRIGKLFADDTRFHTFEDGASALNYLQTHLKNHLNNDSQANSETQLTNNNALYVAIFNDKPIAVVSSVLETQDNQKILMIDNLVMHSANLNRGIEGAFLELLQKNINTERNEFTQISTKNTKLQKIIEKTIDS